MYRYAIMAGHEIGICANDAECDNVETTPSKSLQGDYKWMDPQYKKEKLQFCCVQKSKISARGWQAWKNWFFILLTFLAGVTFWSIIFEKNGQKMTPGKKGWPFFFSYPVCVSKQNNWKHSWNGQNLATPQTF